MRRSGLFVPIVLLGLCDCIFIFYFFLLRRLASVGIEASIRLTILSIDFVLSL